MFQLVKIIDSSAPHQGDIRCFKKMGGGEAEHFWLGLLNTIYNYSP